VRFVLSESAAYSNLLLADRRPDLEGSLGLTMLARRRALSRARRGLLMISARFTYDGGHSHVLGEVYL
jgi:hypothetical protein